MFYRLTSRTALSGSYLVAPMREGAILRKKSTITELMPRHLEMSPALQGITRRLQLRPSPFRFPNAILEGFCKSLTMDTEIYPMHHKEGRDEVRKFGDAVEAIKAYLEKGGGIFVKIDRCDQEGVDKYLLQFYKTGRKAEVEHLASVEITELAGARVSKL